MTTESQRYDCFIRSGGNAIPYHGCPKTKGGNPTTGLRLLWVRDLFRGNSNHRHESQEQAGRIIPKRITRQKDFWMCETGRSQKVPQLHDSYMTMMMMMMTMITCGPTRHDVTSTFLFNIPPSVLIIYMTIMSYFNAFSWYTKRK
jgi:hypothetical protein